jgi:hypothetical protein
LTDAVTQKDRQSGAMVDPVQAVRLVCSEVRTLRLGRYGDRKQVGKLLNSRWQEKLLRRIVVPVPQTDTGGRGENPKTNGRTLVKELGKMTP